MVLFRRSLSKIRYTRLNKDQTTEIDAVIVYFVFDKIIFFWILMAQRVLFCSTIPVICRLVKMIFL